MKQRKRLPIAVDPELQGIWTELGVWTELNQPGINKPAHRRHHKPTLLVFTKGVFDTVAGSIIHPPGAGRIARVRFDVQTGPTTGSIELDMNISGQSIFYAAPKPKLWDDEGTLSRWGTPDRISWAADEPMYFQIDNIRDATGPYHVHVEFYPVFGT